MPYLQNCILNIGGAVLNRIDLCVRSGDFDIASTTKALCISRVGIPFDGKPHGDVIYRLGRAPSNAFNYPYLVVSESE